MYIVLYSCKYIHIFKQEMFVYLIIQLLSYLYHLFSPSCSCSVLLVPLPSLHVFLFLWFPAALASLLAILSPPHWQFRVRIECWLDPVALVVLRQCQSC